MHQTNTNVEAGLVAPDVPKDPQNSSLASQCVSQKADSFEKSSRTTSYGLSPCNSLQNSTTQDSDTKNEPMSQNRTDVVTVPRFTAQDSVCDMTATSPLEDQPAKEDLMLETSREYPHAIDLEHLLPSLGSKSPAESSRPLNRVNLESDQILSPDVIVLEPQQSSSDLMIRTGNSVNQSSVPKKSLVKHRNLAFLGDNFTTVSSQPNGQQDSHPVGKVHKKQRTSGRQRERSSQAPPISMNLGDPIENLRIALLADKFRIQHEHDSSIKHHQKTEASLRELVASQGSGLAEWKMKHEDLRNSIIRLTGKAKTNQKYVTGIQKDYERLQQSVTAFKNQNTETLRQKIAEIENEKKILRKEVESTLDVLSRSQKKLQETVVYFYMRLEICGSEKANLAQQLYRQNLLYEEERIKRSDLEKNLVSSVQAMQHELGDVSTLLVRSVNDLQSSPLLNHPEENRHHEIEQCLEILQTLQKIHFLTPKDISKAEAMILFTQKW